MRGDLFRCNVCKKPLDYDKKMCWDCDLEAALARNKPPGYDYPPKIESKPNVLMELVKIPFEPAKTFVAVITGSRGSGMSVLASNQVLDQLHERFNKPVFVMDTKLASKEVLSMAAIRNGETLKTASAEESGGCTKCEIQR